MTVRLHHVTAGTPWAGTSPSRGLAPARPYRWRGRADFLTDERMAELREQRVSERHAAGISEAHAARLARILSPESRDRARETARVSYEARMGAKREAYLAARAEGLSRPAAARVADVTKRTGQRWDAEQRRAGQ